MNKDFKTSNLNIITLGLFIIAACFSFASYARTKYLNGCERFEPLLRAVDAIVPFPTSLVKTEAFVLTQDQLKEYLENKTPPKKILRNKSIPSIDPKGDYFLLFRLGAKDYHIGGGLVKCYVEGLKFPIDLEVYPGRKGEFKDCIVPIHIDPSKFRSPPRTQVRWRTIYR